MASSGAHHVFYSAIHPDRDTQFRATAPPKQIIKDGRKDRTMCCTNCGKYPTDEEDVKLKKCDVCTIALYCSRDCQKENWPQHKLHCSADLGAGIQPLIKSLTGNPMLEHYIQICLAIQFHLHDLKKLSASDRQQVIRAPLLAHIDVGIEPTKIAQYMNLYTYPDEDDEDDMEGMLQLHDLVSPWPGIRERLRTLTDINIEVWRKGRLYADENGERNRAVVLVEFVNNFKQSITCTIVVGEDAIDSARRAEPFLMQSAITGKVTAKPLSIASCFEYINTHIRSDQKDRLLLRSPMRAMDKELIRDLGRKVDTYATRALKVKMDREHVYIRHSAEFVAEHGMNQKPPTAPNEDRHIEAGPAEPPQPNQNAEKKRLKRQRQKERKKNSQLEVD